MRCYRAGPVSLDITNFALLISEINILIFKLSPLFKMTLVLNFFESSISLGPGAIKIAYLFLNSLF